jgi:hypothetical protein
MTIPRIANRYQNINLLNLFKLKNYAKKVKNPTVCLAGQFLIMNLTLGEGVGTSKIRTSKGQNVESIFRMIRTSKDQNVKNQNVEKNIGVRKDLNVENQKDQLPMAYYLCVPRPVRLGSIRLG